VFTRSRIAPVIFVVRREYAREVVETTSRVGMPTVSWMEMFSPTYWSTPLLDGVIIDLLHYANPFGLPARVRVIGFAPMRLLCELMNLVPPGRLKGEKSVPSGTELLERLHFQQQRSSDELKEQAQRGLGVHDRIDLLQLVRDLYGDDYMPPLSETDARRLRADGEWGAIGATVAIRDRLEALGVTPAEVLEWSKLGFTRSRGYLFQSMGRLHHISPEQVERLMREERFTMWEAVWMIEEKWTPVLLHQYHELVGRDDTIAIAIAFERSGLGIDGLREYLPQGWGASRTAAWAREGIKADEAVSWTRLGFDARSAGAIRAHGGNLAEAAERAATGVKPAEFEKLIKERDQRRSP
jgi:hypothetical protein